MTEPTEKQMGEVVDAIERDDRKRLSDRVAGFTDPTDIDALIARLRENSNGEFNNTATADFLMSASADALELRQERARADAAWEVIDSDYWRNTYDESMARGNAYVAVMRDRLRSVLASLRQERERADTYREGVRVFGEKIRDMGIEEFEQSKDLARAREVISSLNDLAAEHWDWKAGRSLAERLREILATYDKQNGADDDE